MGRAGGWVAGDQSGDGGVQCAHHGLAWQHGAFACVHVTGP